MANRGQPGYTLQEVAEISVVSPTHVCMVLACGHRYLYNPFLATGQSIEERAAQLQTAVGRTWRCKACRNEEKAPPEGKLSKKGHLNEQVEGNAAEPHRELLKDDVGEEGTG